MQRLDHLHLALRSDFIWLAEDFAADWLYVLKPQVLGVLGVLTQRLGELGKELRQAQMLLASNQGEGDAASNLGEGGVQSGGRRGRAGRAAASKPKADPQFARLQEAVSEKVQQKQAQIEETRSLMAEYAEKARNVESGFEKFDKAVFALLDKEKETYNSVNRLSAARKLVSVEIPALFERIAELKKKAAAEQARRRWLEEGLRNSAAKFESVLLMLGEEIVVGRGAGTSTVLPKGEGGSTVPKGEKEIVEKLKKGSRLLAVAAGIKGGAKSGGEALLLNMLRTQFPLVFEAVPDLSAKVLAAVRTGWVEPQPVSMEQGEDDLLVPSSEDERDDDAGVIEPVEARSSTAAQRTTGAHWVHFLPRSTALSFLTELERSVVKKQRVALKKLEAKSSKSEQEQTLAQEKLYVDWENAIADVDRMMKTVEQSSAGSSTPDGKEPRRTTEGSSLQGQSAAGAAPANEPADDASSSKPPPAAARPRPALQEDLADPPVPSAATSEVRQSEPASEVLRGPTPQLSAATRRARAQNTLHAHLRDVKASLEDDLGGMKKQLSEETVLQTETVVNLDGAVTRKLEETWQRYKSKMEKLVGETQRASEHVSRALAVLQRNVRTATGMVQFAGSGGGSRVRAVHKLMENMVRRNRRDVLAIEDELERLLVLADEESDRCLLAVLRSVDNAQHDLERHFLSDSDAFSESLPAIFAHIKGVAARHSLLVKALRDYAKSIGPNAASSERPTLSLVDNALQEWKILFAEKDALVDLENFLVEGREEAEGLKKRLQWVWERANGRYQQRQAEVEAAAEVPEEGSAAEGEEESPAEAGSATVEPVVVGEEPNEEAEEQSDVSGAVVETAPQDPPISDEKVHPNPQSAEESRFLGTVATASRIRPLPKELEGGQRRGKILGGYQPKTSSAKPASAPSIHVVDGPASRRSIDNVDRWSSTTGTFDQAQFPALYDVVRSAPHAKTKPPLQKTHRHSPEGPLPVPQAPVREVVPGVPVSAESEPPQEPGRHTTTHPNQQQVLQSSTGLYADQLAAYLHTAVVPQSIQQQVLESSTNLHALLGQSLLTLVFLKYLFLVSVFPPEAAAFAGGSGGPKTLLNSPGVTEFLSMEARMLSTSDGGPHFKQLEPDDVVLEPDRALDIIREKLSGGVEERVSWSELMLTNDGTVGEKSSTIFVAEIAPLLLEWSTVVRSSWKELEHGESSPSELNSNGNSTVVVSEKTPAGFLQHVKKWAGQHPFNLLEQEDEDVNWSDFVSDHPLFGAVLVSHARRSPLLMKLIQESTSAGSVEQGVVGVDAQDSAQARFRGAQDSIEARVRPTQFRFRKRTAWQCVSESEIVTAGLDQYILARIFTEIKLRRGQLRDLIRRQISFSNTGSTATNTAVASDFDIDFKVYLDSSPTVADSPKACGGGRAVVDEGAGAADEGAAFDDEPSSIAAPLLASITRRAATKEWFHYLQAVLRREGGKFRLPSVPPHLERMRTAFTTLTYLEYFHPTGTEEEAEKASFTLDVALQQSEKQTGGNTGGMGTNKPPNAYNNPIDDSSESFLRAVLDTTLSPVIRELLRAAKRWFKERRESVGDTTSNGLNSITIQLLVLAFVDDGENRVLERFGEQIVLGESRAASTAVGVSGGPVFPPPPSSPLESSQAVLVFVLLLEFLAYIARLYEAVHVHGKREKLRCWLRGGLGQPSEEKQHARQLPYLCSTALVEESVDWELWVGGSLPDDSLKEGDSVELVTVTDGNGNGEGSNSISCVGTLEQFFRPSRRSVGVSEAVPSSQIQSLAELTGVKVRWNGAGCGGGSFDAAELDVVFDSAVVELVEDKILLDPDMRTSWGNLGKGSLLKLQVGACLV